MRHHLVTRPSIALAGATLLLAGICSCSSISSAPASEPPSLALSPGAEVLFLGSSTTAGVGASARDRRWTTLLARAAGWREWNEGLPGSTLTEGVGPVDVPSAGSRLRALSRRHAPRAVVVMYGANDVWRGVPVGEVGEPGTFRNAASVLLRGLRAAFPSAVLVVCTPQPCRRLRASRAPYDAALAAEAARVGAVLVRGGAAFADEEIPRYSADAIHLNDLGQAALAGHVARALSAAGLMRDPPRPPDAPLRAAR
jgi:lysophospholipase L1-like esterase